MMRYFCLLAAPVLVMAQSSTVSSRTDLNGRPVPGVSTDSSNGDKTEKLQSINGRMVPLEQRSERVIRDDANGKVVERVIKRYDATGRLSQTERVMVEETPERGGVKTIKESVALSDMNGRFVDTERRTTETRASGQTTTTNVSVDRANLNSGFAPAERRTTVATGPASNQRIEETVQRPDSNGRFQQTQRSETVVQTSGNQTVQNTATYERDALGKMSLAQQKVATTTKRPGGGEVVETAIYGNAAGGQTVSPSARPKILEQQTTERVVGPDGSVREVVTVRRPSISDPERMGEARKIAETVCTGKCLPEPAKPAAAAPIPAAAPATTAAKGKN